MQSTTSIRCLLLLATTTTFSSFTHSQLFDKIVQGPLVNTASGSRSCNFLDVNNDHFQDILITNGKTGGEDNMLYLNDGNGNFALVNDTICKDGAPSDGATCADFNNDGYIDAYVANWYNVSNLLYQNTNGGAFTRMDNGPITTENSYSETAAWGDFDQDGFIDLYVTNSGGSKKNFLYKNLGNGSFEKILSGAPVTDAYLSRCVNWIDYDGDGDQDIFVCNESNLKNNLYQNDGNGVFTKIISGPLVADNLSSMSSSWGDYDNDGDFDVFIANYEQGNQLFTNDGLGNFTVTPGIWDQEIGCSFSSSFGDYDNDGFLDLFITNGFCSANLTNFLYHNLGNGSFEKVSGEPMTDDLGSSYGCAWGDINNDGFLELIVANWQLEQQENALYWNTGNGNAWMEINLQGTISNESAIGAVVRCLATINGQSVWQTREISAQTGYCSQNSLVAHFGLGDATQIDNLEIRWPSGIEQVFVNLPVSTFYSVIEGLNIGSLGLEEHPENQGQMIAFPNPTQHQLAVQIPCHAGDEIEVRIMNDQGKMLVEKQVTASSNSYLFEYSDVGHMSTGTYFVSAKIGEKTKVLRVQIAH